MSEEQTPLTLPANPRQSLILDTGQVTLEPRDLPQLSCWSLATLPPPTESGRGAVPPPAAGAGPGFVMRKLIGRGGMGEVWEAEQRSLGRVVAVKRLRPGQNSTLDSLAVARQSFRREAMISARLEHPNIVPVHDQGLDESGEPLIAMKRVHGRPWNELLEEDLPKLAEAELLARHIPILADMAQAVAFAHSRGIIHRDLKPSQVMVGEFGEVLLMDWGLAICWSVVDAPALSADIARLDLPTSETATNPSGTPALMAPEQTVHNCRGLGPWTDVYLLGGTLFHLLTGTYPHEAEDSAAAFARAKLGRVEDARERTPSRRIPAELAELCAEALQPAPQDRLPSAAAFLQRLQEYQSGARRQRESREITDAIAAAQPGATPQEYEDHARALAELQRARSLWDANPALDALFHELHEQYARRALAGGDLRLARMQALQLPDGGTRKALMGEVEAARLALERQARQRRLALQAVAALAAIVILGGAVSLYLINGQRQRALDNEALAIEKSQLAESRLAEAVAARAEAEQQRGKAQERVASAQELINFMLTDLSGMLDQRNPRDAEFASSVTAEVLEFVDQMDVTTDAPETQLAHAEFLRQTAMAFLRLSRVPEANHLAATSVGLREEILGGEHPDYGRSLGTLAATLDVLGRLEEGRELQAKAHGILSRTLGPDDPETLRSRNNMAVNLAMEGRHEEALAIYLEIIDAWERKSGGDPDTLARLYENTAATLQNGGRHSEAIAYFEGALANAEKARDKDPRLHAGVHSNMATAYDMEEDYEKAAEHARLALDDLVRIDGPSHPRVSSFAARASEIFLHVGRPEEALAAARVAIARHLPEDAPLDASWIDSGRRLAEALVANGRHAEALAEYDRLLARVRSIADRPSAMAADILLESSRVARMGGLQEEALARAQEAAGMSSRLEGRGVYLWSRALHALHAAGGDPSLDSYRAGLREAVQATLPRTTSDDPLVLFLLASSAGEAESVEIADAVLEVTREAFLGPPPAGMDEARWEWLQREGIELSLAFSHNDLATPELEAGASRLVLGLLEQNPGWERVGVLDPRQSVTVGQALLVSGEPARAMPILLNGLAQDPEDGPSIAARILREGSGLLATIDQQDLDALEAIAARPRQPTPQD